MTKKLTKEEKQKRREDRRKSNQQKPQSPTVKTVSQPKTDLDATKTEPETNLCDECAYEFGSCEGVPKFAGEGDDRVVDCQGFKSVESMPTVDQLREAPIIAVPDDVTLHELAAAPEPAAAEVQDEATLGDQVEVEVVQPPAWVPAPPEDRPDPKRFLVEEDFGNCPSCGKPLKRTAYSRYIDAVRCVNGRCGAYRNIQKTITTGVK